MKRNNCSNKKFYVEISLSVLQDLINGKVCENRTNMDISDFIIHLCMFNLNLIYYLLKTMENQYMPLFSLISADWKQFVKRKPKSFIFNGISGLLAQNYLII